MRALCPSLLIAMALAAPLAAAQAKPAPVCRNIPKVAGGTVTRSENDPNQFGLACNPGFTLAGNASARCTGGPAERWTPGPLGSCQANCPPAKVANATVTGAGTPNDFRVTCNQGFGRVGAPVSHCQSTAAGLVYSPPLAVCQPYCTVPAVNNGSAVSANGMPVSGGIPVGASVTVKCNAGATLQGYAVDTCIAQGSGAAWQSSFGTCSGPCQLPVVEHGFVTDLRGNRLGSSVPPNTQFTTVCLPGFVPPNGAMTHGTCSFQGVLFNAPVSCVTPAAAGAPPGTSGAPTVVTCPPTIQIKSADFATMCGGSMVYTPSDWKLSAGGALGLNIPLSSTNVDNGTVLNCFYSSQAGMASLIKKVSDFGTKCVTNSDHKSFNCYK